MAYSGDKDIAKVLSPEAFCYIIDRKDSSRLEFQLMPDVISESKSAQYNEIPIIGRSLPHLGYAASSSRSIALTLSFVALNSPNSGGKYTTDWVRDRVRWLESKVYPEYLDGFTFPPRMLNIGIGSVIGMQCVMTSCTTSWLGPWDVEGDLARPFRANVDCAFQEAGKNDDDMEHPHGFDHAISGRNQWVEVGGSTANMYVEIPLSI
jgi:hypothetical protein